MPASARGSELLFSRSVCSPYFNQAVPERAVRRAKERKMRLITTSLAAVVVTAAWQFAIPIANAQVETPSPGLSAPAPNITDQKLDAAAAALKRVAVLQQTYRQRLAQAAAQADKDRITAEADTALTNAVADQGLTVEEYFSIMEVAQNDPEVRGKILQRIRPSQNDRN
jgi:hypothetical protein